MCLLRRNGHQASDTVRVRLSIQIVRPFFRKNCIRTEIILCRSCSIVYGLGAVNDRAAPESGVVGGVLTALNHINGLRLHGQLERERVAVLPDSV